MAPFIKLPSILSVGQKRVAPKPGKTVEGASTSPKVRSGGAPHPIPKGREGAVCPISGVSLDSKIARQNLENDPDILAERLDSEVREGVTETVQSFELNVVGRTHHASEETRALVQSVGMDRLVQFTSRFYELCFVDQHLDQFIASHDEPHAMRFATWIMEKLGDGTPWSDERRTRPVRTMRIEGQIVRVAHDRSSAHVAAWFSKKRAPEKRGQHFKLDDARVWMRLHFLAARQVGLFDEHPAFMDYYTRFIAHFVRVYSSDSPAFTRESARWSEDAENVARYCAAGNLMSDVIGQSRQIAWRGLPKEEREDTSWPYES